MHNDVTNTYEQIDQHIAFGYMYTLFNVDVQEFDKHVFVMEVGGSVLNDYGIQNTVPDLSMFPSKKKAEEKITDTSVISFSSSTIFACAYNKKSTYPIPIINAPKIWGTKVAKRLADITNSPFAVSYHDTNSERLFTMHVSEERLSPTRTLGKDAPHIDLSAIAERFGGGGQTTSATFKMPIFKIGDEPSIIA